MLYYEYKNNLNRLYVLYNHSHIISEFLYYSLYLPNGYNKIYYSPLQNVDNKLKNNLVRFNEFFIKMNKPSISLYEELRTMLKNNVFSPIQLCYLFFESDNYGIYLPGISIFDCYSRIGIDIS